MITEEIILQNIVDIRTKKGIKQEVLAEELGMKQPGYSLIEKGKRSLSVSMLLQIAKILNEDIANIVTYHNKRSDIGVKNKPQPMKAILQIELQEDKKDQVLKLVFGENNLEILNK